MIGGATLLEIWIHLEILRRYSIRTLLRVQVHAAKQFEQGKQAGAANSFQELKWHVGLEVALIVNV